jgi:hypothetical protein
MHCHPCSTTCIDGIMSLQVASLLLYIRHMLMLGCIFLYCITAIPIMLDSMITSIGFASNAVHNSLLFSWKIVQGDRYFSLMLTGHCLHWLVFIFMDLNTLFVNWILYKIRTSLLSMHIVSSYAKLVMLVINAPLDLRIFLVCCWPQQEHMDL